MPVYGLIPLVEKYSILFKYFSEQHLKMYIFPPSYVFRWPTQDILYTTHVSKVFRFV